MKFSAIAFATVAAAAAIKPRAAESAVFSVTDFQAACVAHSTQCNYSFKVLQPNSMETEGVSCSATGVALNGNQLPSIDNGECQQSSRTFKIVKSTDGLALFVSQPVSVASNTTGVHQINNSELETVVPPENPNGAHQVYIGAEAFELYRPDYS